MLTLKDAVRVIESITLTSKKLTTTSISFSDILTFGEIAPEIRNNLLFIQKWFNGDIESLEMITPIHTTVESTPTPIIDVIPDVLSELEPYKAIEPDSEWKFVFDLNVWVSDKGTIYSMDNHSVVKPCWIDGDLRVLLSNDELPRRAAPIVCKAFAIHSANRNGEFIIHFNDGDRRNLSPYNMTWVPKGSSNANIKRYYVEDICRRIVEFNGDVDKILAKYEGSKPVTTRRGIELIISKELHPGLSDNFFFNINGKIVPVDKPQVESWNDKCDAEADTASLKEGFDVGGFFLASNDKKMSMELIKDKIKSGETLTSTEEVIVVFSMMEQMDSKKIPDTKKISNVIKNHLGITLPIEVIEQVRMDFTSEIAKVFRG